MNTKPNTSICDRCKLRKRFRGEFKQLKDNWGKVAVVKCGCKKEVQDV